MVSSHIRKQMKEIGFEEKKIPILNAQNVFVFNRVGNEKDSNFFVIVAKRENKHFIHLTDPLAKKNHYLLFKVEDQIPSQIIEKIAEVEKKKARDTFYFVIHGHYGYYTDFKTGKKTFLMSIGVDDGVSPEDEILLQFMLYHVDFDFTGHHNHYWKNTYSNMKLLEEKVGMIKLPGAEITMPVHLFGRREVVKFVREVRKKLGIKEQIPLTKNRYYKVEDVEHFLHKYASQILEWNILHPDEKITLPTPTLNGPHVLVAFKNEQDAFELQEKYLNERFSSYPPLAPKIEMVRFLAILKRTYKENVLVIPAHPFCDQKLPDVGIADRVKDGDLSIREAIEIVRKYADGIVILNPTLPINEKVIFDVKTKKEIDKIDNPFIRHTERERNKKIKEAVNWFMNEMRKNRMRSWDTYTLNYVFAKYFERELGLPVFVGHDIHNYGKFLPDKRNPSLLAIGRNEIKGIRKSPEAFFRALKNEKRRENKKSQVVLFVEKSKLRKGSIVPLKERVKQPTLRKIYHLLRKIHVYGIKGIPKLFSTLWKIVISEKPRNWQELIYAFSKLAKR